MNLFDKRAQLESWTRRRAITHARVASADRVAADGLRNTEIGGQLGVHFNMVAKWRSRFAAHRIDGLVDEPRRHCDSQKRFCSRYSSVRAQHRARRSAAPPRGLYAHSVQVLRRRTRDVCLAQGGNTARILRSKRLAIARAWELGSRLGAESRPGLSRAPCRRGIGHKSLAASQIPKCSAKSSSRWSQAQSMPADASKLR